MLAVAGVLTIVGYKSGIGSPAPAAPDASADLPVAAPRRATSVARPIQSPEKPCSTHFNICISNADRVWKTTKDAFKDYDLYDQKDAISLALVYSDELSFKGSGKPFTAVSLLGQKLSAYKRSAKGVTQVITGTQLDGATLIVMINAGKDITAAQAVEIIGRIKTNK